MILDKISQQIPVNYRPYVEPLIDIQCLQTMKKQLTFDLNLDW